MKLKYFFILVLSAFLLLMILALTRGLINFEVSSFFGFILFFLTTFFYESKFSTKISSSGIFICLLGIIILFNISHVFYWHQTLISLPDSLLQILGCVSGFLFFTLKRTGKWAFFFLPLLFSIFVFLKGYKLWLNKINYGTYTGSIFFIAPDISGIDQNSKRITNKDFKGKNVVLDFWTTTCGACLKKFPIFQEMYNSNRNDTNILFYAANIPLDEDTPGKCFRMINKFNYTFPVLLANDKIVADRYKVDFFPTTIVINRDGNIVYKGGIEGVRDVLKKLREF